MKTIKDIEYSYKHTKDRFKERYDIELSRNDYDHLCDIIRNSLENVDFVTNADIWVEHLKNDTQYIIGFPLKLKGKDVVVVWSEQRDCITTALPKL
jgi:hypothetical protein